MRGGPCRKRIAAPQAWLLREEAMRSLWIVGGAIAGGKVFGLPGTVLGGGLGYVLSALPEILRRLEAVERAVRQVGGPDVAERATERYPEERVIDAMQQAENEEVARGEEMEDIFSEVSGKKKRLH
jgi:hypothetical protein